MPFLKEEDTPWRDFLIGVGVLVIVVLGLVYVIFTDFEGFAEAVLTRPPWQ